MCAMAGALVLAFFSTTRQAYVVFLILTRGVPAALLGVGTTRRQRRLAGVPGAGGGGRLCTMAGALMRITRSGTIGEGMLT